MPLQTYVVSLCGIIQSSVVKWACAQAYANHCLLLNSSPFSHTNKNKECSNFKALRLERKKSKMRLEWRRILLKYPSI